VGFAQTTRHIREEFQDGIEGLRSLGNIESTPHWLGGRRLYHRPGSRPVIVDVREKHPEFHPKRRSNSLSEQRVREDLATLDRVRRVDGAPEDRAEKRRFSPRYSEGHDQEGNTMSVHIREIYPGKWYLRISYKYIRKTKACSSKEKAIQLKKKLEMALELYGMDALKILEADHESEIRRSTPPEIPTIDEYQKKWLAELEKTDLKKSTKDSYSYLLTKHVVPAFGTERLNAIDYSKLKAWVIAQAGDYSKDSVRLQVAVLRTMIQEAVNEGILPINPVMKLGKFYRSARRIKEKIDPFTIEELHLIEIKCRERFPKFYSFILCLARTGMRIGEVTALQWIDIDFERNYIIVRRNIPHHRQVETTKTVASQRKVDMSPELSAELKQLRTERKKQALADGTTFDMEEWIFRTDEGTPIYYTNFLRRIWHKVQDLAQVRRRTPHDLRHTWASHMLAGGADLAYVSNQLGHANPSITLRIYSHWVPGTRRITTSILDTKSANMSEMTSHPS
jgi:integrase